MTSAGLKDELLDAELLRTLDSTACGGAEVGERLAAAANIRGADLDSWYEAWTVMARRVLSHGVAAQEDGDLMAARSAFFRASSYFRTSGVMLMGPCTMRAWSRATHSRATIILTGGYDVTAEELYFLTGAAALVRGYNVVAFDGLGQGAMLLQQSVVLRSDWEAVITPVIDHICARPGIDPDRIALFGLSLGANLAPRAASVEHRLAACIADCGSNDLHASAVGRVPKPLGGLVTHGRRAKLLERALDFLAAKPTAGWAIRRGESSAPVAAKRASSPRSCSSDGCTVDANPDHFVRAFTN